jgi:hypothetical protein
MNHSNESGKPVKQINVLGVVAAGSILNGGISYYDAQAGGIDEPNQLISKDGEVPYGGISTQPMPNRVIIYEEAPVAESVEDDMSFNEAFRTARNEVGPGGVFHWKGQLYNTYYREEWAAMSAEEQAQYEQSVPSQSEVEPHDDDQPIIIGHSETVEETRHVQIDDTRIVNGRIIHRVGIQNTQTITYEEILGDADQEDPDACAHNDDGDFSNEEA